MSAADGAIATGDPDLATRLIGTGLVVHESGVLRELRRVGLFRASRRAYAVAPMSATVGRLKAAAHSARFSADVQRYLESIASLHILAREVAGLRSKLIAEMRECGPAVLDGLLRTLDFVFMAAGRGNRGNSQLSTPEHRADAVSELWALHAAYCGGATLPDITDTDTDGIIDGRYLGLIDAALPLRRFLDWERRVDALGYTVDLVGRRREIRVRAPRPETEMSIQFGFMRAAGFVHSRSRTIDSSDLTSTEDLVASVDTILWRGKHERIVERVESPRPKLRVRLPLIPELLARIGTRDLLAREAAAFAFLTDEFALSVDELQSLRVSDAEAEVPVDLWSVLVLQRVIRIVGAALAPHLARAVDTELPVAIRSLLPSLPRAAALEVLGHVLGHRISEEVLNLLTGHPESTFFDVLYQPVFRRGDAYVFATHLIDHSELVRNTMQLRRIRVAHGNRDPADAELAAAIQGAGGEATANVVYRVNKCRWETDVVGRVGNTLLVLETKRSLLPTNNKELQSTLDAAADAAAQLDRSVAHLADATARDTIEKALGWSLEGVERVLTCIVLSNRMLAGERVGGHPIRSLHELLNYLKVGTITLGAITAFGRADGQERVIPLWTGDRLSEEDLRSYLLHEEFHRKVFASMVRQDFTTRLGSYSVVEESYALHRVRFYDAFTSSAAAVDASDGVNGD